MQTALSVLLRVVVFIFYFILFFGFVLFFSSIGLGVVDDLHVGECFVVVAAAAAAATDTREKRDDVVQSDLDAGRNGRYVEYIYNSFSFPSFFSFSLLGLFD